MALTQVDLANMVTGVLPVANGGTGSSSALVPSGTYMLFGQTAAPTGWTKITTNNNAALRVVSGSASTGGTVDFTTAFASQAVSGTVGTTGSTTATNQNTTATGTVGTTGSTTVTGTVGGTTLSTAQMPSHNHPGIDSGGLSNGVGGLGSPDYLRSLFYRALADTYGIAFVTLYTGGSGSHDHSFSGGAHTHTSGAFTGTAHTHTQDAHTHTGGTFTGTAINLAVKYVDVIMATKD